MEVVLGAVPARAQQLDVLEDQVDDALAKGASLLVGGERRIGDGNWFDATVLVNVDHTMDVMREESFGPLVPVMEVADDEEAVQRANSTAYGLSAHVFGPDDVAELLELRQHVGMGNVAEVRG